MENKLYKIDEVINFINQGKVLSLAGDERLLAKLPKGNWIAGTTAYFMNTDKGKMSKDEIFVNEISDKATGFNIKSYTANDVTKIVDDTYENGFSLVVVPPFTDVHQKFALEIPNHEDLFNNPISGWVAGFDLNSQDTAKVFNGLTNEVYTDKIVALHIELPKNYVARLEITNIFTQNENSKEIEFLEDGFSCKDCLINGEKTNFAEFIRANNIDIKLPLVADYSGAMINVSFQEVADDEVKFYAPIFKGVKYKLAKKFSDYVKEFNSQIDHIETKPDFSCNCILNYLYGELEGKKINNVTGPITFGEVGYQLLNQTLTFLYVEEV